MIRQFEIRLKPFPRGFHLIDHLVLEALPPLPEAGLLHLHLQHTSAALTLNENADPTARADFRAFIDRLVPENLPYLTHTLEGPDDMPAHIKAAFFGASVSLPITQGRFNLGTWQGIYLCEFRDQGGSRRILATLIH